MRLGGIGRITAVPEVVTMMTTRLVVRQVSLPFFEKPKLIGEDDRLDPVA
jgi:hypothetical protein